MAVFSMFVQAAEGSTFGIVPYVHSKAGSVAGLVGAGGNIGGACFACLMAYYDYRVAFSYIGITVMASAVWTVYISIPGHRGLLTGRESSEILTHRRQAHLPAEIVIDDADLSAHSKLGSSSCGEGEDNCIEQPR